MTPVDGAFEDAILCDVCGRETCEDHVPPDPNAPPGLIGLTLAVLGQHVFPERPRLLLRGDTVIFRAGHLGEIYAERGFGKTWLLQTLALVAAAGTDALGFRAPDACRVLYVDGEMASGEIQERFTLLCDRLKIASTARLTVVAADWQESFLPRLDTVDGQVAIEPFVAAADLIVLDNRSCLLDPEGEKDPTAWQPAQDWLLSLRRRGKAVLIAHHSNRMGGARGHSKPEDAMNLLIKLSRPEDYQQDQGARFIATFDKCRGAYGSGVAPFLAHLTPDGWRQHSADGVHARAAGEQLLEYVRLAHQAGERAKSANDAISKTHLRRTVGLAAWAELLKGGDITKHPQGGFYVP